MFVCAAEPFVVRNNTYEKLASSFHLSVSTSIASSANPNAAWELQLHLLILDSNLGASPTNIL
jgi:hypothetical protein